MSQKELALLAGISREAIIQLETGRTRTCNPAVATVLAGHARTSAEAIEQQVADWVARAAPAALSRRGQFTLKLPPEMVRQYRSFADWRRDVEPSPNKFASLLRMNRTALVNYEAGRTRMPKALYRGLTDRLGLSEEYVDALVEVMGK